ncbi:MAG: hypothetical protein ILO36_08710 [Abditibacteriota bacterium]|nr:hypothetical protein [Abditibacteriota bacterium]
MKNKIIPILALLLAFCVSAAFGDTIVKKSAGSKSSSSKSYSGDFPSVKAPGDYYTPGIGGSYYGFQGMISPDGSLARRLGLTSSQKKKLNTLNRKYMDALTVQRKRGGGFGPVGKGGRYVEFGPLYNSYEKDFKRILTSSQKSRYESLKRRDTIDRSGDYFIYGDRFYDYDLLSPLDLTVQQRRQLDSLNEIFRKKMQTQSSMPSRRGVYNEYDRSVRSMLNKKQKDALDDILYGMGSGDFPMIKKEESRTEKKYSAK